MMGNNEMRGQLPPASLVPVYPTTFDDVEYAINLMKDNKSLIVYTQQVSDVFAQRVMDYLCGASFALGGDFCELARGVYIIAVGGVTIVSSN